MAEAAKASATNSNTTNSNRADSILFAESFPLRKIVSGGQTGVDRAALDAAIFLEIEHGGWCPAGRRAEDGRIDDVYQLRETTEFDYSTRTEKNVIDSDGTLIIHSGELSGGTRLTYNLAKKHRRPHLLIDLNATEADLNQADHLVEWIRSKNIQTLNVAGPREQSCPGIAAATENLLVSCLQ